MKIIQSFWTKPMLKTTLISSDSNRFLGGWLEEKFHYLSWALSCLQLKKHYNEVELYTDLLGKEILIDKLGLPYTAVHLVLDDLVHYNPELWAIGKVYTYGLQNKPFIHVDSDVYIGEVFPPRIEKAQVVTQNIEKNFSIYDKVYDSLRINNFKFPKVLEDQGPLISYNAGIFGGNHIDFIKSYSTNAIHFVDMNLNKIKNIDIGMFNIIFEQLLLYYMTKNNGIDVECLFKNEDKKELNSLLKGFQNFIKNPQTVKYIHLFGEDCKKNINYCDVLADKVLELYPEYYNRITKEKRTV